MSEPNNEPMNTPDDAELVTLRKLRDELLQSKHTQKARITELESQVLQLTEAKDTAEATVRAVIVDQPVRRMAAELSPNVPELVLRELQTEYDFDVDDLGAIVMKSKANGKQVTAEDGKPLAFDQAALYSFLTGKDAKEKTDRQRVYTHILGVRVGGRKQLPIPVNKSTAESKSNPEYTFGLR